LRLAAIAYLIAGPSLLLGLLALNQARSGRLTAASIEALTGDRTPLKKLRSFVALIGILLSSGGLALLALSRWAAPIFLLGMLLATAYLIYASRALPPIEEAQALGRRRTILAIYVYAVATALVLWLESQGVLR
jgi:hypothetical protein